MVHSHHTRIQEFGKAQQDLNAQPGLRAAIAALEFLVGQTLHLLAFSFPARDLIPGDLKPTKAAWHQTCFSYSALHSDIEWMAGRTACSKECLRLGPGEGLPGYFM